MEGILNNITFYHELVFGVPLNKFLSESVLSQVFVPVATFNEDKKNQEDEIVAMIEGAHFPIFGSAVSLEKIQFNDDLTIEDDIDHSKVAIRMAQRLANLFVDEARLCQNTFLQARDEYKALI